MRKKYEVKGMMEWHPVFKVGRSRMQVSFTGGHLCGGGVTPASFETADAVVQSVIERSEAFRSGRIRLGLTLDEDPAPAPKPQPQKQRVPAPAAQATAAATAPDTSLTTETFETLDEAADFLHFNRGLPVARLMDEESCVREGAALGLRIVIKEKKA